MLGVVGVKVETGAQAAAPAEPDRPGSRSITLATAREVVIEASVPQIPVGIDGESVLMDTPVRCASGRARCGCGSRPTVPASRRRQPNWTGPGCAARRCLPFTRA